MLDVCPWIRSLRAAGLPGRTHQDRPKSVFGCCADAPETFSLVSMTPLLRRPSSRSCGRRPVSRQPQGPDRVEREEAWRPSATRRGSRARPAGLAKVWPCCTARSISLGCTSFPGPRSARSTTWRRCSTSRHPRQGDLMRQALDVVTRLGWACSPTSSHRSAGRAAFRPRSWGRSHGPPPGGVRVDRYACTLGIAARAASSGVYS